MRNSGSAIIMAISIILGALTMPYSSIYLSHEPNNNQTSSNDGFGPTNYTDEHTYVTVGEEGRYSQLRMPGGHDYSKPLPLVVSLHGFGGSGCLLYTSPSPRDKRQSRMPSSA